MIHKSCRYDGGGVFAAPPSLQFVRQLHAALGPRHKENLKMFYVVHPTAMLKAAIWGMTTFNFGVSSRQGHVVRSLTRSCIRSLRFASPRARLEGFTDTTTKYPLLTGAERP